MSSSSSRDRGRGPVSQAGPKLSGKSTEHPRSRDLWLPHDWANYVMEPWQDAVESIIETGRRLIEAKENTDRGDWLAVTAQLPFTDRTCRMLMAVARHPVLSNRNHGSDLPASWRTLYELGRLPDLEERLALKEITPELERKTVLGWLAKLSFLKRFADFKAGANRDGERWEIRQGDFRTELQDIPDGSVDGIVTDPPYGDEYLELWDDLGAVAARLLRPGTPLIAWTGQIRLPLILETLANHLTYAWTISLDMPGANSRVRWSKMIQTWKPIIVFTSDTWAPHEWHHDKVVSPAKDQGLYEWQQHPDPAAELIDRYVAPGGLVLDPFTGVGSFGVAALTTGRRFLGVELDEDRAGMASSRLAEL